MRKLTFIAMLLLLFACSSLDTQIEPKDSQNSSSKIGPLATDFKYYLPFESGVEVVNLYGNYHWDGGGTLLDIHTNGSNRNVVSIRSGTVVEARSGRVNCYPGCGGTPSLVYGNLVIVNHGDGSYALYAHLDSVAVSSGQSVGRGQKLGVMGNTGQSDGAHLHLELRSGSSADNSYVYAVTKTLPSFVEAGGQPYQRGATYISQNTSCTSNCGGPVPPTCTPAPGAFTHEISDNSPSFHTGGIYPQFWWRDGSDGSSGDSAFTYSVTGSQENYGWWDVNISSTGTYDIYAFIPNGNGGSGLAGYPTAKALGASYNLEVPGVRLANVSVNQEGVCGWVKLFSGANLSAGTAYTVSMGDSVGGGNPANRRIYYDNIALIKTDTAPSPAIGNGTGLLGEYWNTTDFSGPRVATSLDGFLNVNWGADSPNPNVNVDGFSARWTGQIQPKYSGEWTFSMQADDGIRLYVNNQLVIDHWAPSQLGPEYTGKISLTAGQKYDLKLEFYEGGGGAGVLLRWAHQYQPIEVVPTTQLYPAVAALPKWTLNPTSLEFNGTVGSTPASKTFTITNTGGVHTVFGMGSSNDSLVTATGYSASLAVGASTTATVIVGPCTAVGTTTGQLTVDGGGSNATMAITRVCGDQPTTPPLPTSLSSITMSSKGRILISWPEVSTATHYDFEAKFDGAAIGVSGQAPNRGGANGAAVATFISNPDAADKQGKEICFSIRANNAGGSSGFSDFACTTYKYYAAGLTVQSATDIPQLTLK
jgi:hypothetical protein